MALEEPEGTWFSQSGKDVPRQRVVWSKTASRTGLGALTVATVDWLQKHGVGIEGAREASGGVYPAGPFSRVGSWVVLQASLF